jgi:hypothetical protein
MTINRTRTARLRLLLKAQERAPSRNQSAFDWSIVNASSRRGFRGVRSMGLCVLGKGRTKLRNGHTEQGDPNGSLGGE